MIADEWKVFFDSEAQTASSLDTELMFWRSVGFWPLTLRLKKTRSTQLAW